LKSLAIVAGISFAIATSPTHADANSPASHEHSISHEHSAAKSGVYVPGLGEIMFLQQMRHAKLWLAGANGNWPLASYELEELREGFGDASKLHPTHGNVSVATLIAKLTPGPLEAIEKAIDGKRAADFKKSFDRLTAACNTCHQEANHGFIQVKRPSASAFTNQKFEPGPK
jgi:hypothetical protein